MNLIFLKNIVWFLVLGGFLTLFLYIFKSFISRLFSLFPKRKIQKKFKKRRISVVYILSLLVFFSVFTIRYSVGLFRSNIKGFEKTDNNGYSIIWENGEYGVDLLSEDEKDDLASLTKYSIGEEIGNSIVHALQTFSLDESYDTYYNAGKIMFIKFLKADGILLLFLCFYSITLNVLAPVLGGAILLGLIGEIFPDIKLFFAGLKISRKRFYFSELNEKSLALAKSILEEEPRSIIIFTDAYADKSDEKSSECITEAISIGAVCVKYDMQTLNMRAIRNRKKVKFFLMDESENSNLELLTSILDNYPKGFNRLEIFIFSSDRSLSKIDEEVAYIVNQKRECIRAEVEKKGKKKAGTITDRDKLEKLVKKEAERIAKKMLPVVVPINGINNMTLNLFTDVPLYEPLVCKRAEDKQLTVTIFGSGVIGTELFLTTYWCGQILNRTLNINVVSKEKQNKDSNFNGEGNFEGKLNNINPEILQTQDRGSELLKVYKNDSEGDRIPYFNYRYIESDVMSDGLIDMMQKEKLLDTDYFIIALGSDEDNFTVADNVRKIIGRYHMAERETDKKTVISYVFYNSDLCRSLNSDCRYRYVPGSDENEYDVYMYAFGDLESLYSHRNVFMDGVSEDALKISDEYFKYSRKDIKKAEKNRSNDKIKNFNDIYSYQSDIARSVHIKYKKYSAGFVTGSIFKLKKEEKDEQQEDPYTIWVMKKPVEEMPNGKKLLHELAWLEHRRWNAYMRTKGFRSPSSMSFGGGKRIDFTDYYSAKLSDHDPENHKYISLKLHPCIVECSKKGIDAAFDDRGILITESEFNCKIDEKNLDLLDITSRERYNRYNKKEDFKRWDYPSNDFGSGKGKISIKYPYGENGEYCKLKPGYNKNEPGTLSYIEYISEERLRKVLLNKCNKSLKKEAKNREIEIKKIIDQIDFASIYEACGIKLEEPFEKSGVKMVRVKYIKQNGPVKRTINKVRKKDQIEYEIGNKLFKDAVDMITDPEKRILIKDKKGKTQEEQKEKSAV